MMISGFTSGKDKATVGSVSLWLVLGPSLIY
jgi:hypothetical protein